MFLINQQTDACCEGSLTLAGISCVANVMIFTRVAIVTIFSIRHRGGICDRKTVNWSQKKIITKKGKSFCAHFSLMSSGVVTWW